MADFVLGNQNGPSYCFMNLCPIAPDAMEGQGAPLLELRRFLGSIPQGNQSPLAGVTTIHLARFVIVDNLPYEGYPQKFDRLGVPICCAT